MTSRRGNGGGMTDQQARYNIGALEQRVYGLEQGVQGLSTQITGISQQIAAGSKTNWSVIIGFGGISISLVIAIGGMAYWPIRETQADLKVAMAKLADAQASAATRTADAHATLSDRVTREFVSVRELDARSVRTQTDLARLREDIKAIDVVTVPRGEHTERWRAFDNQITDHQRQIDDLKRFNAGLVSVPDFLKSLDDRMRQLERRPP